MKSGSLLDEAMRSLEIDDAQEKRENVFNTNKAAVKKISNVTSSSIDNLKIHPSIGGESDSQPAQPLVKSKSFQIDLSAVTLPSESGGETLKNAINRICREQSITGFDLSNATCTTAITLLAGQHAKDDRDLTGATKAEFVPVFANDSFDTKRVLALCYSTNGQTPLRLDHMRIPGHGEMTCLARSNKTSTTALKAIEIDNLVAKELKEEKAGLFAKLQQSACVVAFIEYDLEQYPRFEASMAMAMAPMPRGVAKGVSAYSTIGQGSHTTDHSRTVHEDGRKIFKKVHVYIVGAMVLNTNGASLADYQCENVAGIMGARAEELNNHYKSIYQKFNFKDLISQINSDLVHFNVSTSYSDIFEHGILRIGGFDQAPRCKFEESRSFPNCIAVTPTGISHQTGNSIATNLRMLFNSSRDDIFYNEERSALYLSTKWISRNYPALLTSMKEILANPRNLRAYKMHAARENPIDEVKNLNQEANRIMGLGQQNHHAVGVIFAKMFNCDAEINTFNHQFGEGYVASKIDTLFTLGISAEAARAMVLEINRQFPDNPAQYVSTLHVPGEGRTALSTISIDTQLLANREFRALFNKTAESLLDECPLLVEQLRIASGSQLKTSMAYARDLSEIANHYSEPGEGKAEEGEADKHKQEFVDAILKFSTTIADPKCNKEARLKASGMVRRKMGLFESDQSEEENRRFTATDKKTIEDVRKTLKLT